MRCLSCGETLLCGVGGKYAGVQAAGGAASVEKGVELTSVRRLLMGGCVLSAAHAEACGTVAARSRALRGLLAVMLTWRCVR